MIHLLFRTLLVWAVLLGALTLTGLARPPAVLAPSQGDRAMSATRRSVLAAALSLPFIHTARAQAYPDRPIRLFSPYPPGATNDNTARTMSQALTRRLGQPVVVENRAGGRRRRRGAGRRRCEAGWL